MTDPLDDLKAAFDAATPPPDPAKRADTLARAQEIYDRAQGSGAEPRPTPDRPTFWAGVAKGVGQMLSTLTARPSLTVTTALVAVGLVALIPVMREGPPRPGVVIPPDVVLQDTVDTETEVTAEELARVEDEPVLIEPSPVTDQAATGSDDRLRLGFAEGRRQAAPSAAAPAKVAPEADGFGGLILEHPAPFPDPVIVPDENTEAFANEDPNPVKIAADDPVSTFSIDVDTASYSVVRSSLMNGYLPPADAVRIEEMVNYFPYRYPVPAADDAPFRPTITLGQTPWNPDTQLMHIALQGRMPALDDRPPLNLVFLIDTSGSMDQPNKLPLLKQSFRLMLGQLDPQDQVAIVTYAGSAGRVLDATPSSERATILAALDRLGAGGSTAGQAGLQQAYATAEAMATDGEVTRVILATDGDFNVGLSDPERLKDFIAEKRDSGTYLSVLGFGRGNLDDATMQALAQNGNGQAAYIDTLSEAQKVLVDQLTGALFPIANDVKIQVEFNPVNVAEYRLIGYETRELRREDFNNDRVDAGEIGAGHAVTAIYEITPMGSPAVLNDPLRYTPVTTEQAESEELAFLRLRYKEPGADVSQLIELPITPDMDGGNEDSDFAAAIAGFGQLLQGGVYLGDWSYADAISLAEVATGEDTFGYRREAVTLMRLADSLSQ
ncbi:MAG: VWA domain-containing protein [Rhodobacter sp.]|nr:VWA domain-containing protein [Rhodobacter sp.]